MDSLQVTIEADDKGSPEYRAVRYFGGTIACLGVHSLRRVLEVSQRAQYLLIHEYSLNGTRVRNIT